MNGICHEKLVEGEIFLKEVIGNVRRKIVVRKLNEILNIEERSRINWIFLEDRCMVQEL